MAAAAREISAGNLGVRVTASEKEKLKEDALNAGLSISELIRRRYFGRPILSKTDETMIRELRRQGGLLKHIWSHNSELYSEETAAALRQVQRCIAQLVPR